ADVAEDLRVRRGGVGRAELAIGVFIARAVRILKVAHACLEVLAGVVDGRRARDVGERGAEDEREDRKEVERASRKSEGGGHRAPLSKSRATRAHDRGARGSSGPDVK